MTKEHDSTKPDTYWAQSSNGIQSLHKNDGKLNFQQSLIGHLVWMPDDKGGGEWKSVLKDGSELGSYPTMYRARVALEDNFRGNKSDGVYPRRLE